MKTSIHPQIQKISRITDSYGKTKYPGRTFKNNEFALEETRHKTYNVPVGRCSLNTSQVEHNFLDMHSNTLTYLGESNKKKESVPDGPTIKYS